MSYETDYNKQKLEECLDDIGEMFVGLKTPLSKYFGGENGIVLDEKVTEFINRIIFNQCTLFGYDVGITGIKKRHIELLCYLVLRAFDPDDSLIDFSDFLDDAKALDKSGGTIQHIVDEANKTIHFAGRHRTDILQRIRVSCKILTGRTIADDCTEEEIGELKKVRAKMYADERKLLKKKEELEKKLASLEKTALQDTEEAIRAKYEDYGIEGTEDYWEAVDNEYFFKYGLTLDEIYDVDTPINTYDRKLGRHRTAQEEAQWQKHKKELEEKWKQSFENPEDYLNAYKEFLEINVLVDEFSGEHNLEDSIKEILALDGRDLTENDADFLKYYSELNRIVRILKRRA